MMEGEGGLKKGLVSTLQPPSQFTVASTCQHSPETTQPPFSCP